nr:SUF system NifU family Fe-S cluster assembly protein [Pseudoclavibacter chungangensis]
MYQEVILDHSRRRAGEGELPDADAAHFERNPTCGDELTMRVRLDATGERVKALAWQGDGCSISMASASVLSELAVGRTVEEVDELVSTFRELLRRREPSEADEELLEDAIAFRGVAKFVMRVKCAMLAWVALEAAVAEARVSRD